MKAAIALKKHLKGLGFFILAVVLLCVFSFFLEYKNVLAVNQKNLYELNNDVVSIDMDKTDTGYSAVLYDNTSGLSTSEANAIVQTEDGFLWIGSYSGLTRYDGNSFYRLDSSTGIANVVSLYVDPLERLWVGTNDSGVFILDHENVTKLNRDNGLNSLSIRSISQDSNGIIYLGTTQGVAYVDTDLQVHTIDDDRIENEYIRNLYTDLDNNVYVVTKASEIFKIKDGEVVDFYDTDTLGFNNSHVVAPDNENPGFAYIGTSDSIAYYCDFNDGFKIVESYDLEELRYVNSIEKIGDKLWFCCDNGIGYLEEGKVVEVDNLPMDSSVMDVMADYLGNLWFVSSKQGVMKVVVNQFLDIYEKYGFDEEVINSTCMYEDKLFIGTKSDGIKVVDGENKVDSIPLTSCKSASGVNLNYTDLISMLDETKIRSIIKDSKGYLWISTFSDFCLMRYKDGELTLFTTEDGMPSNRVRAIYEREDGAIMAACTDGLAILEGDAVTRVYDNDDDINNLEILSVCQFMNGEMVVATDGGGIYILDENGTSHIGIDEGLSSEVVMKVKKDKTRDILWIVTSNSISYMTADHEIFKVEQFPYSNNFDFFQNSKDEMWILSSNGIYVVETETMLANGEIEYLFYDLDNGLPCITTSNSYSELTLDGDLYIAGTTGVAKVNIESSVENVANFKMAIPYVDADGERIFPDENGNFVIPSSTKKLTIYSYIFNYSLMNPVVTYKLEGFEDSQTSLRRSELTPISYSNLAGGQYKFVLSIKDTYGDTSKTISISIVKRMAYYEYTGIKILKIILIFVCILIIIQIYLIIRTRRYKKEEAKQKQLVREIVEAFAKVIDMKDKYTNGHSSRVAHYTAMLATELGYDEDTVKNYYNIALLHDIGKIGIPAEVLNKPGKLTEEEYNIIKSHCELGYDVLKNISIMPELAIGAYSHHERIDGKGYPRGLAGDEIPKVAQIIAVADTFDTMYSNRPYRKRMNFNRVVEIMKEVSGKQLSSEVVEAFLSLVEKGEFIDPNDDGEGSMEDIDNIRNGYKS